MFLIVLLSLTSACHCQPTLAPWMTATPPAASPLPPMIIEPYTGDPGYYMVATLKQQNQPNEVQQPQYDYFPTTTDNRLNYENQPLYPYTAPPAPPSMPDSQNNNGNYVSSPGVPVTGQQFENQAVYDHTPIITENRPNFVSSGFDPTQSITESRPNPVQPYLGTNNNDHPRNTQVGVRNVEPRPYSNNAGNRQNNGNNVRPTNNNPQSIPENRQKSKNPGNAHKQHQRSTHQFTSNAEKNFHMKNIQPFLNNIITHGDSAESYSNQIQYSEKPPKLSNNQGKNVPRKRQNFVVDIQKSVEIPFEHMPYASEMSDILSSGYFNNMLASSSPSPNYIEMKQKRNNSPARGNNNKGYVSNVKMMRDTNIGVTAPTVGMYDNAVKGIFQGYRNMPIPTKETVMNMQYMPAQSQMIINEQLQAKETRNYQNKQILMLQNEQNQRDVIKDTQPEIFNRNQQQMMTTPATRYMQQNQQSQRPKNMYSEMNPTQEIIQQNQPSQMIKNGQTQMNPTKDMRNFQQNAMVKNEPGQMNSMKDMGNFQQNENTLLTESVEKDNNKMKRSQANVSLFRPETVLGFQELFQKTNSEGKVTMAPDSEAAGDAISFYVAKNPVNIFVDDPELVKVMSKYYKGSIAQFIGEPMSLQSLSASGRKKNLRNQ